MRCFTRKRWRISQITGASFGKRLSPFFYVLNKMDEWQNAPDDGIRNGIKSSFEISKIKSGQGQLIFAQHLPITMVNDYKMCRRMSWDSKPMWLNWDLNLSLSGSLNKQLLQDFMIYESMALTMKDLRISAMLLMDWTGSLQKIESIKCCNSLCWKTSTFGAW